MADVTKLVLAVDSTQVKKADRSLQGMEKSGLNATTMIKTLATGFVALEMVSFAKETAMMAARFETLGVVMQVVGNNAGYTGGQMEEFAKGLQSTGIAMIESRETIIKMAQAQIDLAQSTDLARIAQDAAVIGGVNSSEAFARLTRGIQTAQVETLRTIGINVSFEDSYKKLANQLGKNAKDLTTVEKTQARVNGVMESGELIAGAYAASMDTAGKQMLSMKRYIDNLKVVLGETFNDALILSVSLFTDGLKDANDAAGDLSKNGDLKAWGEDATNTFANVTTVGQAVYRTMDTITSTVLAMGFELASFSSAVGKAATFDFDGAKGELDEMAGTLEEWKRQYDENWGKDFATEALKKIREARVENREADEEAKKAFEQKRIAAKKARKEADKITEATKKAATEANNLKEAWAEVASTLMDTTATAGLEGIKLEYVKIGIEADKMRESFGPEYSAKIDAWQSSMQKMALATELEANAAAKVNRELEIFEENALKAEKVTEAMDELSLASLSVEEREKEMIRRQYTRLQGMVDQMVKLKAIAPEAGEAMKVVFGEKMQEDLDGLGDKTQTFMEQLQDGTAAWAQGYASNLNDMLWSSETTFDGVLQSFGKMITEMLIQSAMLDLFGGGGGSGGLITQGLNMLMPSAAGGYDVPSGVNPMTQLHEEEMVLPAKYANAIRDMTGPGSAQQPAPKNDVRIINVQDMSQVGDYLGTADGEQAIMNIIQKNGIQ